jgi:hypothetical protein
MRSEIELWQAESPDETNLITHSALKRIRLRIEESNLEEEPWYQKLDDEARYQYARSGRALLQGLSIFLSTNGDLSEARALGYEYAARGRRYGLSRLEAISAFLFFRSTVLEAILTVYESSGVQSPRAWGNMLRKVTTFTDQILRTLVESYENYQAPQR